MAIVLELQEEALKSGADILALLRKSSLIARKLDLKDFQEWINNELNGYKFASATPDYRDIRGELKAWNPYNGWIPVVAPDNELEKLFSSRRIRDSIPSLYGLLNGNNNQLTISINASGTAFLNESTDFETVYKIFISKNAVSNIIEQVRNKILDWAITLEENGIFGEGLRFTNEEKSKAQSEPQIVNYISNFFGSVTDAQIQQGATNSKQNTKKSPFKLR